jgi:hypothetical protein
MAARVLGISFGWLERKATANKTKTDVQTVLQAKFFFVLFMSPPSADIKFQASNKAFGLIPVLA